jgi:N-acetylneuraminic acid mutarotase
MARFVRLAVTVAVLSFVAARVDAQTVTLTVHTNDVGAYHASVRASVRVVSGAVGACTDNNQCTYAVNKGAIVRLAADYPGRFSAGTGPASACALSTCTFTMTTDADVTATFTAGDGPTATLTTTLASDGAGIIRADGVACSSGSCTVTYLQGSTIELGAEAGAASGFVGYSAGTGPASVCGTNVSCTFTLSGDASITGTFLALASFTVAPSTAFGVPGGPAQMFTATGTYSGGVSGVIPAGKGKWSAAPSLPAQIDKLAAAGLGGKVYAIGGYAISFDPSSRVNSVYAFDPVAQTWTSRAPMLVKRASAGATTAGGLLYAIGGIDSTLLASVERYDPGTDTWTMRASMSVARDGLVVGTVNGIIYAAGGLNTGGNPVATLEAYDPATDTWTVKAPMATARSFAAGGVIDGILYVAGGSDGTSPVSTVEAYNPATNTWTAKAPMPAPLSDAAAAVADGVLYVMAGNFYSQSALYAYDPVTDSWSIKAPVRTPRSKLAAASLNGIIYAVGGDDVALIFGCCNKTTNTVQTYVDSLRWSSSAPAVARIDQTGLATPRAAGTTTIIANVGGTTCGSSCPTFSVVGPTDMSLDAPANNTSVTIGTTLTIGGWALNKAAPTGTGVDAIHVYAVPDGGTAIFLGVAPYGEARPDVGAIFGSQFTNSGFTLKTGSALAAGIYTVIAYAHNALTQQFDVAKSARVTITPPVSNPFLYIDTPQSSQIVTSAFEVGGWAIDAGAPSGTGVDAVHVYAINAAGAATFLGVSAYGFPRADIGGIFGSAFTNSGYNLSVNLAPGAYSLRVYSRSTVSGTFSYAERAVTVLSGNPLMTIDTPANGASPTRPFLLAGWAVDLDSTSGPGVDAVHVWAYPTSGAPIFVNIGTLNFARGDVGAIFGTRFTNCGYNVAITSANLPAGTYLLAVYAHSTVTGTFNQVRTVTVTVVQ